MTASSTLQTRNNHFDGLEFVEEQADIENRGNEERHVRQREQDRREWTGESTTEEPAEFISDRRSRIIEG